MELDDTTAPAAPSTWQKLEAAYAARTQSNDEIERLSAQEMADNIRARYPDAAALVLEDSDQGPHFSPLPIVDAQGKTLHEVSSWEEEDDEDLETLASNFNNDSVSPLLTNKGTRRFPSYQLDLAGHTSAEKEAAEPKKMTRVEGMAAMTAHIQQQTIDELRTALTGATRPVGDNAAWKSDEVANLPLPHVPLADLPPSTRVYVDHPEIQAGAVRDKVVFAETEFQRRREGVYPSEPYQMRFQASRPIDDAEMQQMASAIGYAYASKVRGEGLGEPVRDSPYSFVVHADTTKSRRDDLGQAMEQFEAELPTMVREGSPIRTTNRTGSAGTRAVLGLGDPDLTFETYYDSVTNEDA